MANFVLVPGYWLGGWAWKNITDILREQGHTVYPVTLTGLGERVHLGNAETNLDTHVADVVGVIKYEELDDVYLVGHSYAGVVITQVANEIPEKLAKIIYVDSAPLPDGTALVDFNEPKELAAYEKSVAKNGENRKNKTRSVWSATAGRSFGILFIAVDLQCKPLPKLRPAVALHTLRAAFTVINP